MPTVIEAGVPGYEAANWIGVVATAGTPEPIVARLHKEISAILDLPEVQKLFASEGADIVQHERGAVRRLYGERDREMGPRRQAGRHQGAVKVPKPRAWNRSGVAKVVGAFRAAAC